MLQGGVETAASSSAHFAKVSPSPKNAGRLTDLGTNVCEQGQQDRSFLKTVGFLFIKR